MKVAILGVSLATAFSFTAHAAVWDGFVIITNVPHATCGGVKKGQSFLAVFRPKIGTTNPEKSQINIFIPRNTVHIMANNTSQFKASGPWLGLIVQDDGLVANVSGTFNSGVVTPAPPAAPTSAIVATTVNLDFSANFVFAPGTCTLKVRGGFTRRVI